MGDNSMDVDELFKKMRRKPSRGKYSVDRAKVYRFIDKLDAYFDAQKNNEEVEPAVFKIQDLRDYFNYTGKTRLSVVVEKMIKDSGYIIKQSGDELIFMPKVARGEGHEEGSHR